MSGGEQRAGEWCRVWDVAREHRIWYYRHTGLPAEAEARLGEEEDGRTETERAWELAPRYECVEDPGGLWCLV